MINRPMRPRRLDRLGEHSAIDEPIGGQIVPRDSRQIRHALQADTPNARHASRQAEQPCPCPAAAFDNHFSGSRWDGSRKQNRLDTAAMPLKRLIVPNATAEQKISA
jgi:hypothetical protein